MTSTSKPCSARRRAATKPSPPLLPRPQTATTGQSREMRSSIRSATALPAAPISVSAGIFSSWMARRSISCISSRVTYLIRLLGGSGIGHLGIGRTGSKAPRRATRTASLSHGLLLRLFALLPLGVLQAVPLDPLLAAKELLPGDDVESLHRSFGDLAAGHFEHLDQIRDPLGIVQVADRAQHHLEHFRVALLAEAVDQGRAQRRTGRRERPRRLR